MPMRPQGEFNYPRGAQGELILIDILINPIFGPTFEAPPNGIRLECQSSSKPGNGYLPRVQQYGNRAQIHRALQFGVGKFYGPAGLT